MNNKFKIGDYVWVTTYSEKSVSQIEEILEDTVGLVTYDPNDYTITWAIRHITEIQKHTFSFIPETSLPASFSAFSRNTAKLHHFCGYFLRPLGHLLSIILFGLCWFIHNR